MVSFGAELYGLVGIEFEFDRAPGLRPGSPCHDDGDCTPSTASTLELQEVHGPSALGGSWGRFLRLTWLVAATDYKLTYFGSVLGYVWSLMQPLLFFGVLYVVFAMVSQPQHGGGRLSGALADEHRAVQLLPGRHQRSVALRRRSPKRAWSARCTSHAW